MEHRNLGAAGGQAITVDGGTHTAPLGTAVVHAQATWAHVEGTGGYLMLGAEPLTVLREQREGILEEGQHRRHGGNHQPPVRHLAH